MTEKLYGTIIYAYTPEIHDIFLKIYNLNRWYLSKDDKVIEICQTSSTLKKLLMKHGYKIQYRYKISYTGKNEIFGYPVEISKHMLHGNIMELNIKLSGNNMAQIRNNMSAIICEVAKKSKVPPTTRIWNKLENC